MLIIIIKIIMSKIQFLIHIRKKDLFLPAPTEVAFNTTNFPRFYSPAIHFSPIILVFSGLLGMVSYSVTE